MQITLNILDELKLNMMDKANARNILNSLDNRIRMIYNHIYNPKIKEKTPTFFFTEENETMLSKNKKLIAESDSKTILKFTIDYILNNLSIRFQNEFSAHFVNNKNTGFFNGRTIHTKISFLSFCSYISSDRPNESKTENLRIQQELENKGYIIKYKNNNGKPTPFLIDCDINRKLLKTYITNIGGKNIKFESIKNTIDSVSTKIDIQSYPIYKNTIQEKEHLYIYPLDYEFTEDDKHYINKLISDIHFALYNYKLMLDNNCIPNLLISYMYKLERLYGLKGEIWKKRDNEYQLNRERNAYIQKTNMMIQKSAFAQKDKLPDIMNQIETELKGYLKKEGLLINHLRLYKYGNLRFEIIPHYSPNNHKKDNQWIILKNETSISQIESYLQKKYPNCKLIGEIKAYRQNKITILQSVTGEIKL